jgi:hypothetical protein
VGGQRHAPAALPPGKTRYPLCRWFGGPQGRSGRVRNISPSPGFDSRTVQPVASCYTDWAIAAYQLVRMRHCKAYGQFSRRKSREFAATVLYRRWFLLSCVQTLGAHDCCELRSLTYPNCNASHSSSRLWPVKSSTLTQHEHRANSLDEPLKFSLILSASDVNITFKYVISV